MYIRRLYVAHCFIPWYNAVCKYHGTKTKRTRTVKTWMSFYDGKVLLFILLVFVQYDF